MSSVIEVQIRPQFMPRSMCAGLPPLRSLGREVWREMARICEAG